MASRTVTHAVTLMPSMEHAWRWLCQSRKNAPANADIWHLRFYWEHHQADFWQRVIDGKYRLSPMRVIRHSRTANSHAQWCAADALVLKWVALHIASLLPIQPCCTHVAGHRGGRETIQAIAHEISRGARFVYRTDIKGYYRHIPKMQLWLQTCRYVKDPVIRDLLRQYIWYTVEDGGEFYTPNQGICRGCALSPLLGASFLWHIDSEYSGERGLYYARYMDDFIFLSERRWPIKRAIARLHALFEQSGFSTHPDKTQVGRIEKGFDWLGLWFTQNGAAGVAPRALENHRTRRLRLEERARRQGLSEMAIAERVQQYEARWSIWARSMLNAAS